MRFGLSICSYVYNDERAEIVKRTLASLGRTNLTDLEKPVLRVTYSPTSFDYVPFFVQLNDKFNLGMAIDPPEVTHTFKIYLDAGSKLLREHQDVTHLVFLWDDFIYNPEWLRELSKLIERHSDAVAWSVYRSAYTEFHRITGGDGVDVTMTMHDGMGCVTREEWLEFERLDNGATNGWSVGPDTKHASLRPGNRWATSRDYMQNICPHKGIETVDCAIDFVGEG